MCRTWLDELIEVLRELGGEASLPDIINQVKKMGRKKLVNPSSIRDTLQAYCPQKNFRSNNPIFYHRGSQRSGIYGLIKK